jgi:hypothetical protein
MFHTYMKNKITRNPVHIIYTLPEERCSSLNENHLGTRKTRYGLWWILCGCYVTSLARTRAWTLAMFQAPLLLPLWNSLFAWSPKIRVNLIAFDWHPVWPTAMSALHYNADRLLACLAINSLNTLHSYIKGNRWAKLRTFPVQGVDRLTARGVSSAVLW